MNFPGRIRPSFGLKNYLHQLSCPNPPLFRTQNLLASTFLAKSDPLSDSKPTRINFPGQIGPSFGLKTYSHQLSWPNRTLFRTQNLLASTFLAESDPLSDSKPTRMNFPGQIGPSFGLKTYSHELSCLNRTLFRTQILLA
jgi:hypothetical protein